MNDRIKQTFDEIHAETELKEQTKDYIAYKTNHYTKQKKIRYSRMIPAVACVLFLIIGSYRLYFTETSMISIDINPSIELNLNRFDRVISINSYNDDGQELANALDIKNMYYMSAIQEILNTESMAEYLSKDEMLSISVVGRNEEEQDEMLANIETCIPKQHNVSCHKSSYHEAHEAHSSGLSVGKYRAFLELQKVNPDITIDDVKGLTMRQIRDLIGGSAETETHESEHNGCKKGH